MKLFLRDEIFASGRTELFGFFLAAIADHDFVELDEEGESYRQWLLRRSTEDREEIQAAIRIGAHSTSVARLQVGNVAHSDWKNNILSVTDALNFIRTPYHILVENSINDRRFVFAVANVQQRDVLRKAESAKNIVFENGGGINDVLKQLKRDAQDDYGKLRRTFVLVDGDALWRSRPSEIAKKIRKFCQEHSVPFHILRRRSAENYLTLQALHDYSQSRQRLHLINQAFSGLSPMQRYHYHMKEGFLKKTHGCQFLKLDRAELTALLHGWGDSIGTAFEKVSEHDLLCEGAMRELAPMMRKLIAHIR